MQTLIGAGILFSGHSYTCMDGLHYHEHGHSSLIQGSLADNAIGMHIIVVIVIAT